MEPLMEEGQLDVAVEEPTKKSKRETKKAIKNEKVLKLRNYFEDKKLHDELESIDGW